MRLHYLIPPPDNCQPRIFRSECDVISYRFHPRILVISKRFAIIYLIRRVNVSWVINLLITMGPYLIDPPGRLPVSLRSAFRPAFASDPGADRRNLGRSGIIPHKHESREPAVCMDTLVLSVGLEVRIIYPVLNLRRPALMRKPEFMILCKFPHSIFR